MKNNRKKGRKRWSPTEKQIKSLKFILTCALMISTTYVMAQTSAGNGSAGINAAESQVRGYFDVGTKLMTTIGAVTGIIGALKVYSKWNHGDPDTTKVAASWFGSCIFLVVVAAVLRGFFL